MERILVGMTSDTTSLWSFIHALNLAKRMKVQIAVLLVEKLQERPAQTNSPEAQSPPAIKTRLEKMIHEGRAEGTAIDYYLSHGCFKDELIKFIQEKKTTLLVVDSPLQGKESDSKKFSEILGEIKLRTQCRIEIVHQKDI